MLFTKTNESFALFGHRIHVQAILYHASKTIPFASKLERIFTAFKDYRNAYRNQFACNTMISTVLSLVLLYLMYSAKLTAKSQLLTK